MKLYTILILITFQISCVAQNGFQFESEKFEQQFLSFEPTQNQKTSEKDFKFASMIIRETKKATDNNPQNFNLSDYFNILTAFVSLHESQENVQLVFDKFKNSVGSCEYFISFEETVAKNPKFEMIRADYNRELAKCKGNSTSENKFDVQQYSKDNKLDLSLIKIISTIDLEDKKHRGGSSVEFQTKQGSIDVRNQEKIDSLYAIYCRYIGRTLVGNKFESVMWAVIQHSNVEMMEKYLPIVQQAVTDEELDVVPLKMLIDRYYGLKYGYQVFGSQSGFGFDIASEQKRKEIERKYGIE